MNELAAVCKIRIFTVMKATLSQLNRTPGKIVRPVIRRRKTVVLTHHGKACAKIVPLPKIDRKAAADALRAVGPVEFLPRK